MTDTVVLIIRIFHTSNRVKGYGMVTSHPHKKWFAKVLLLIYFILSTSTVNASFWCEGPEMSAHLETNLAGRCLTSCFTETGENPFLVPQQKQHGSISNEMDNCSDSPALFSAITSSNQSLQRIKIVATDIVISYDRHNPRQNLTRTRSKERLTSPLLPQRQALSALRSFVLLH